MRAFKDCKLLGDRSSVWDVVFEDRGLLDNRVDIWEINCVNEASADAILEALAEHAVNVEVVQR